MIQSGLLTEYFYVLFLWAIIVSNFFPLGIHKHLVLILSSITFTANSQADNHFSKYICFKYYTVRNQFFVKIHVKVFIFKFDLSVKYHPYASNKRHGLQKMLIIEKNRFFSVDYVKINELHVVHTWRHMQSEYIK